MKNILYILLVLIIIMLPVAANPSILHFDAGQWYNDREELQDGYIIREYTTIIEKYDNWTIEVLKPHLTYHNAKQTYNNGETIIITSGATITLSGKHNTITASKSNPIIIEVI